jgi:hypothetical protein
MKASACNPLGSLQFFLDTKRLHIPANHVYHISNNIAKSWEPHHHQQRDAHVSLGRAGARLTCRKSEYISPNRKLIVYLFIFIYKAGKKDCCLLRSLQNMLFV